uniref:EOG090X01XB n=1 Tax=Daphnia sinensis TaxID=1820382 RepID=A0A4Y7N6P3_9CRUS|nr:EOG090X01XB [Daphnia sinensis]
MNTGFGATHHFTSQMRPDAFPDTEPRSPDNMQLDALVGENLEELGIRKHTGPRYITFATLDARLKSYGHWPPQLKQTPRAMAQAGFFHLGVNDHVNCFHCGSGLRNWEPDDDPWLEHARWFPQCRFVMLMKGEQYIKEAKESMSTPKVKHSLAASVGSQRSPPREVSEAELRSLLGTPIVQTVLAMGVDLSRVKQALKYQIRNTGQPFDTVDSLLEAAIEFQHYNEHRQSLENGNGKEASTSSGPAGSLQVEEKRRRAWEQWSADDIAAFFEGLNEFGKDFDAIQNCLYTKNRKKSLVNSTNIKNKDQVRHFYYRTWHKISKYLLPTPDEGKRMHKELYGLINYGEMWKKLGGYFNDRCGEKLNELVQHGVTSVKIKGKSYRIKTPVCPALKRLQSTGTETQKLPSTPERIVIELTPCCNADFLRVQSVAHNPRIRISTDSSSPLSTIISFLTKKWKPRSILEAESVAEDELIMRVTPEMKQVAPIGSTKKGRKRTFSGQEQMDETEVKLEVKSWILETSDQVTFSRMRQRLRRPLRYGTSLKRGSLAATLNKMPGPSPIQARPHPSSLMAQSTTVNITWPPEENGNGTGSFVLQVQLDGQQQQTSPQKDIPTASVSGPLYLSPKKGPDIQNGTGIRMYDLYRTLRWTARLLLLYYFHMEVGFAATNRVVENKLSYFREDLGKLQSWRNHQSTRSSWRTFLLHAPTNFGSVNA